MILQVARYARGSSEGRESSRSSANKRATTETQTLRGFVNT